MLDRQGTGIFVEGIVTSELGLASHRNAVSLLRLLAITDDGEAAIEDLILELEPNSPFAVAKTWRIDRRGADSAIGVPECDVELTGVALQLIPPLA